MGDRRKVLVVFHEDTVGGATRSVLRALPVLERRGWRFVFHVADPSPLAGELRSAGYDVRGAERHLGFSLRWLRHPPGAAHKLRSLPPYLASLGRTIRRERPALVHANSLYSIGEAAVARALGVPVLFHVHEMLNANWKGPAARGSARLLGLHTVAVSRASAARYAGGRGSVPVVHESTTIPPEPPPPPRRDGRVVVGAVGNVSRRKGTDVLVEAARILRDTAPEVDVELVGPVVDDPDRPWAEDVLRRARQAGVRHVPSADVFARLATWDLVAIPSRWDPFPLVVLEAMASARPVVGARVDGIPEQLGDAGVLVPPEDPAALAAAIVELARDPARRRSLGEAARRRVTAAFTPEHQADALEREYLRLVEGRRR